VRARTTNVGEALVAAFRGIEEANPNNLHGIFGNASWTNQQKLPDRTITALIEHFSEKPLTNACVPPDVFGQAYEYLIKRFADLSNKKAGEYYTPRPVVKLMVNILDPREGETVYDPACGTGGMLIEVIQHVKDSGGRPQLLRGKLFGQEKVLTTSGIARMNLLLHGVEDFRIVKGDTLRHPAFFTGDRLTQFDCVIANPPFSLKRWGEDQWPTDSWGRYHLGGIPPRSYGDWAWVQHMAASMAPRTGRAAVVLPQGALFRTGAEAKIRRWMLERDYVEAVIGLAPNMFYGAALAASILVLSAAKPADRRGKTLFVNAEKLFRRGRNQNTLEPEHVEKICKAYEAFTDERGFAHVADATEIAENEFDLKISLYVEPLDDGDAMTLDQALTALEQAQASARVTRQALQEQLTAWGLL
jgi:type I restriction system adenine methylase HsdM